MLKKKTYEIHELLDQAKDNYNQSLSEVSLLEGQLNNVYPSIELMESMLVVRQRILENLRMTPIQGSKAIKRQIILADSDVQTLMTEIAEAQSERECIELDLEYELDNMNACKIILDTVHALDCEKRDQEDKELGYV